MESSTALEEFEDGDVEVVRFEGELDLDTAPALCVRLAAARARRSRAVVLDLSRMTFCDSQGLRALIGEQREMRIAGKRFGIIEPEDEDVQRIFDLAGVREMLQFHAGRAEALAVLRDA
jgi:anti-sigma B factor antagonist